MTNANPVINNFHDSNVVNTNGDFHFSQYETQDPETATVGDPNVTDFDDEASPPPDDEKLVNLPGFEIDKNPNIDNNPSLDKEIMNEKDSLTSNEGEPPNDTAKNHQTTLENANNSMARLHKMNNNNVRIIYGQKKVHQTSILNKFQPVPRSINTSAKPFTKTLSEFTQLENIKRNLFTPAKELLKVTGNDGILNNTTTASTQGVVFNGYIGNVAVLTNQHQGHESTGFYPQTEVNIPPPSVVNPYLKNNNKSQTQSNSIPSNIVTDTPGTTVTVESPFEKSPYPKPNLEDNNGGMMTLKNYGDFLHLENENEDKKPSALPNFKTWTTGRLAQQRNTPILPPELECLQDVILSQHSALETPITDLGKLCLNFTKIVEQKKEVALKLIDNDRIPKSLRFKTELLTSPRYQEHPEYIRLKLNLKQAVDRFVADGIAIFREWSEIHIQLLIQDRCHGILQQAIHILKGLYSYWLNIIKYVSWPEEVKKYPVILLCKIFFQTDYSPNIDEIRKYFELPSDMILLQATKIVTKRNDDNFNLAILNQIDLSFLEDPSPEQFKVISETLTSFNIILYATTIELWDFTIQKSRISEASAKLKAQMESERVASATKATAQAINNAVDQIRTNNNMDQTTQLRIHNLEKLIKQHEDTINHLSKSKNSKGSHIGPMTSPNYPTLNTSDDVVDLTMAQSQSPLKTVNTGKSTKKRKSIQWNNSLNQIKQFHPSTAPTQMWESIQRDNNLNQIKQYHPSVTPTQMFAPSSTLNQPIHMNQPLSSMIQQLVQPQETTLPHNTPPSFPTPPNPFYQPIYKPPNRGRRGARSRGGRGGSTKSG